MAVIDTLTRVLHDVAHKNPYTREPISGWNRADHPIFAMIQAEHPFHRTPDEMLYGAQSVFAFFLPFTDEVVHSNQTPGISPKLWAEAYIETNRCIKETAQALITYLNTEGYHAVAEAATHNFDRESLVSSWSHKHIAYACGLGSFGLHQMVITSKGCAGRFGSIVTDLPLEGKTQVLDRYESCQYFAKGVCRWCIDHCPTKALTLDGLDKQRCYEQCLEMDSSYPELGLCDVCGKCAVGPCGMRGMKLE